MHYSLTVGNCRPYYWGYRMLSDAFFFTVLGLQPIRDLFLTFTRIAPPLQHRAIFSRVTIDASLIMCSQLAVDRADTLEDRNGCPQ